MANPLLDTGSALLQKPFTPEALARKVWEMLGAPVTQKSILVADDDGGIRSLLRSILENDGYQVHTASNGKEALNLLKGTAVNVVLTDLAMPERDGIEMIMDIRKDYPDLKVVAMSGTFEGAILKSAKHLGANAILAKPLEVEELLRTLQDVLQRHDQDIRLT